MRHQRTEIVFYAPSKCANTNYFWPKTDRPEICTFRSLRALWWHEKTANLPPKDQTKFKRCFKLRSIVMVVYSRVGLIFITLPAPVDIICLPLTGALFYQIIADFFNHGMNCFLNFSALPIVKNSRLRAYNCSNLFKTLKSKLAFSDHLVRIQTRLKQYSILHVEN